MNFANNCVNDIVIQNATVGSLKSILVEIIDVEVSLIFYICSDTGVFILGLGEVKSHENNCRTSVPVAHKLTRLVINSTSAPITN